MPTESCSATDLAWSWVIQSVAQFKQVDSSTLTDLVKNAPAIKDNVGKDAREIVSLRILEKLLIHETVSTLDIGGSQIGKISFDVSDQCEDVLHKILDGTSGPMTELVREKWNVRPFISHKRTSLPKSPLQKLKEALLKGNHPQLASLKKMSKIGCENVLKNTIQKEREINMESHVIGLDENTLTDDVDPTLSKKLEDTCGNVDIDLGADDNDIQPNVSVSGPSRGPTRDGKKPMENGSQVETGTDSEKSYDDGTDIARKKEAFLSSQQTLSQDFMATIECSEIYLCMKCNKDGQLLVCSSDTCPIRVHENCLGSAAKFDENGDYFCPFCAYSHAISKYLEVKKNASLARKNVQVFLSSGIKGKPKIYSEKEACLDNNELRPPTDVGPSLKKDKVSNNQDPMISSTEACVDNNELSPITDVGPSPKKDKVSNNQDPMISSKEDCAPAVSPHRPIRMRKRQLSETESYVASPRLKRSVKGEPQYKIPNVTLARRKNLPWSKSEEDVLQEGVQKFPASDKKGIPWKDILHFGGDVFDKSRTTIDLKDKWRNLCKRSPSSKKQKL